ncbi:hypothetical protein VNO77_41957 [Canavalia gladiata]|uniref:Uncharacterized protein n=1 Tax=Canavalia gladiata TaxID=3824 RepID=A0AAN9JZT5_CANGL
MYPHLSKKVLRQFAMYKASQDQRSYYSITTSYRCFHQRSKVLVLLLLCIVLMIIWTNFGGSHFRICHHHLRNTPIQFHLRLWRDRRVAFLGLILFQTRLSFLSESI